MAGGSSRICHGALIFDQIGRVASLNGEPVDLSARELGLLEIFLQRAGRLVSKDQLVSHLCEWGEEVSGNAIEVYVHRLRKKLEPGGVRISTVRGLGYSLEKREDSGSRRKKPASRAGFFRTDCWLRAACCDRKCGCPGPWFRRGTACR